ncbi:ethanolamine ammonia-lyase subunit EutC [Jiella sp. MQZ9-1]|uniref:Ethanolamine ammonia-lyase small subunit n=1 Tax=Jiella flava TaxID=2816857 RepID=A0A939FVZ9_9HYPH|nr:ethanolamine ammonia-lyase subunit EutC [Jiella flava]MBO0661884.1 ethanolamine ammonia-lyase subunit EutC [Jiella flava]MCD2470788.1 ethanolamine ammonia-lyase subunit EutC [Jiella flava]
MSDKIEIAGPDDQHPLSRLRAFTEARIGLGRHGAGLPTRAHLDFAEAHARARDAVHSDFQAEAIAATLESAGFTAIGAASEAGDRATYLRRPDLGRRLSQRSVADLASRAEMPFDLVVVVADGLSATAVNAHGAAVAMGVLNAVPKSWRVAPVVVARGARVALSDPIGAALRAKIALMLIGERPGLSAANSLGAYLTFAPKPGRSDADRNCVSNIRPGGLRPEIAGDKLAGLIIRAAELGLSGTKLKDDADDRLGVETPAAAIGPAAD